MRNGFPEASMIGAESSIPVMVGQWYLDARSAHRDAQVIEAYRQLQLETDRLFALLTGATRHCATRVVFTRCAEPYSSDDELIHAVRTKGILEMTSAVTSGRPLHPLLDCAFGGTFDRFRAVHDLIGHAWSGYGFDLADECAAWSSQDLLHSGLARCALATELYGVNAARSIVGDAPDLRALLLTPSVLRPNSSPGVSRDRAGSRRRWRRRRLLQDVAGPRHRSMSPSTA